MPSAYLELGNIRLNGHRDLDGAIRYFERAIQLNPRDAQAHFGLGSAYRRKGDLLAAEIAMRRAVELDPKHERAHYFLGTVLQRQGKKEEAAREFASATKVGPTARQENYRRIQVLHASPAEKEEQSH